MTAPGLGALADRVYDGDALLDALAGVVATLRLQAFQRRVMLGACGDLRTVLDTSAGPTLQERWRDFEERVWPVWDRGVDRPRQRCWTWGAAAVVVARAVRPGWGLLGRARSAQWVAWLPDDDELRDQAGVLERAVGDVAWASAEGRYRARWLGVRVLLAQGHGRVGQIVDEDLRRVPARSAGGMDVLDAALCRLGVLERTPQRGATRRLRARRLTPAELAAGSAIPERFRAVHVLYLETYARRISDVYATTRHKHSSLGHLWEFMNERYPQITGCAEIRPAHLRAFIPHAIARARQLQRRQAGGGDEDSLTAHQWLINVRCFFADVCTWATEAGSPFAPFAPPAVPLERHDLVGVGFEKARRRQTSRSQANVLDLERETPNLRALALRGWHEAEQAVAGAPDAQAARTAEADAFWDWALLELLLQSGLRIEEACELTTLDVMRRRQPDGRTYYMLHITPSKFDRARVIPISDGLGRVIAEIIRHVKAFYGTDQVPACDRWDEREKRALVRAPYLLQGAGHPSPIAMGQIRSRLARLSRAAGACRADGSPLILRPHDCRRLFASEHLNNNTPVHVIQALLGHATINTVMVYAKLYPATLVEEYRKAVRATYADVHGEHSLRNPTAEEWAAFTASCSLRDMGTHLCALPTGEHCAKGLVCLGCNHAQPKKSAAPVFRRMLASHQRALAAACERGKPAGQLAARELEINRIESALRRADELTADVAAAIEAAA